MASDGAGSALLGSAFWREEVEPMRGRGEVPSVGLLVIVGAVSDMVTLAWFRRGLEAGKRQENLEILFWRERSNPLLSSSLRSSSFPTNYHIFHCKHADSTPHLPNPLCCRLYRRKQGPSSR
jgi:hypothetical protein